MNALVKLKHNLEWLYFKNKNKDFVFKGKFYKNLYNKYNATWINERKVEVPIFLEILKNNKHKKILEVGNVLSHYTDVNHTIVDKYEVDEKNKVINMDILHYRPKEKYDLILSISTLEHVGKDCDDPKLAIEAIKHLYSLLKPGCALVFTFPRGYNRYMDRLDLTGLGFKLKLQINKKVKSQGLLSKPDANMTYVEIYKTEVYK